MRNILLVILFLINSVWAQSELSPKETFIKQTNALADGKISELWKMAPKSWKVEIESNFRKLFKAIPLESRKDIFELFILISNTLKDKEALIVEAMLANNISPGLNEKDYLESVRSFGSIFELLIKSQLADQKNIENFDMEKFIKSRGDKIAVELKKNKLLNQLIKKEQSMSLTMMAEKIKEMKVEEKGTELTATIGDQKKTFQMQKIDGVWMPDFSVESFKEYQRDFKEQLNTMKNNEQNAAMMAFVLEMFKKQIQEFREAKTLDDLMNPEDNQADHEAIEREKKFQRVQAEVLGKTLAKQIKKKSKCLIIHHPVFGEINQDQQDIFIALQNGLGDKVTEIKFAAIKEIKAEDAEIEEALMENTAEDFNKVIKANKDCDIVVTTAPLPFSEDEIYAMDLFKMIEDPDKPGFWIKDPKQKYPVFGIYNGYIGNLEPLFHEQLIHAMSMWKPNPTIDDQPVPKDVQQAFDKRYIIMTPNNIKDIKKKYPNLFPKPRN